MPTTIVFDVNETLSDLSPLADRFAEIGVDRLLAKVWFASVLRDGFALTITGGSPRFAELAPAALRTLVPGADDDAVQRVLDGFGELPLHPDIVPGVRALADAGWRLVTLSNGATSVADGLLRRAGIRDAFAHVLSVEEVGRWKPSPHPYAYAARTCGVAPAELVLVAVHPWDLHGAAAAGLATGFINRTASPWPPSFTEPVWEAPDLSQLASALGRPG